MPHCVVGNSCGHRRGQQVGRGVAVQLERFGALVGDNPHGGIGRERKREVHHLVVDPRGEGGVGEPRGDSCGDGLKTGVPGSTDFVEPSGSVTVT